MRKNNNPRMMWTKPLSTVLLVLSMLGLSASKSIIPPPPLQNPIQAQVWQNANAIAAQASSQATPLLLAYLNSSEFRSQIVNLTMFANATAQELLQEIRTIVTEGPLQHNFPIVTKGFALDVNLTDMMENGFVPNLYTAVLEGFLPNTVLSNAEDVAEVKLMGFPDFANASSPTLAEALNRPQYLCINAYHVAGGCIGFGQISLVLPPTMRNYSLISPVDTGIYTICCLNGSAPTTVNRNNALGGASPCSNPIFQLNCSGWDHSIATFEHFDHVFLANADVWNAELGQMLIRKYDQDNLILSEPNLKGFVASYIGYMEGDLAAAILFPQSVQYIQSSTSFVFGTPEGLELIEWTYDNNWPLAWVMGINTLTIPTNNQSLELDLNNIILDPYGVLGNLTISEDDLAVAQKVYMIQWQRVSQVLSNNTLQYFNSTFWYEVWSEFSQGMPESLFVKFPTGACALLDNCFAVSKTTGDCVCI